MVVKDPPPPPKIERVQAAAHIDVKGAPAFITKGSGETLEYLECLIKSETEKECVVLVKGDTKTVKKEEILKANPMVNDGAEDMIEMSYLHEAAVLHNLSWRYQWDMIYTYTGPLLIAINPFKRMPVYYCDKMVMHYQMQKTKDRAPHIFAVSDVMYRNMRSKADNPQAVIISGESGAGKTETAKLVMTYLAAVSSNSGRGELADRILQSNPILEAFGNAKTQRNDNSSRFGKFIEIQFAKDGKVVGASIRNYLLEKSRVVEVAEGERSYHVFYMLCVGTNAEEKREFGVHQEASKFGYLKKSSVTTVPTWDDVQEFKDMKEAFTIVGIKEELRSDVFRALGAILNLGDVTFNAGGNDSSSLVKNKASEIVAQLLGVDLDELATSLTTRKIETPQGIVVSNLNKTAAESTRDCLAKAIMGKMFDWLVEKINDNLSHADLKYSWLGVLDIFGFEFFQKNSFEQLCINYCNEKLQNIFVKFFFQQEQDLYKAEQIDWSYIQFTDNAACVELLEGNTPMGILAALDETCRLPRGTPQSFVDLVLKTHKGHQYLKPPKFGNEEFIVHHYAASVNYHTGDFLEKNKDSFYDDLRQVMMSSKRPFFASLFQLSPAELEAQRAAQAAGKKKAALVTLGGQFKSQLVDLYRILTSAEPSFVRCIKPNSFKKPVIFDRTMVLNQLRSNGILDAVRISQMGYPGRAQFNEIWDRYKILAPTTAFGDSASAAGAGGSAGKARRRRSSVQASFGKSLRDSVVVLLAHTGLDSKAYQVGLTRVFFRPGQLARLEELRIIRLGVAATMIQKNALRWLFQKKYKRCRAAIVTFQKLERGFIGRLKAKRTKKRLQAAIKIQTFLRARFNARKFSRKFQSCVRLQGAFARRYVQSRYRTFCSLTPAAITLQGQMRNTAQRATFDALREGILIAQAACKGHLTRSLNLVSMAKINSAIDIQRFLRQKPIQIKYAQKRASASKIKSFCKSVKARNLLAIRRRAAQKLQALIRTVRPQKSMKIHKEGVATHKNNIASYLQSRCRSSLLRAKHLAFRRRAIKIEACLRGHKARNITRVRRRHKDAGAILKSAIRRLLQRRRLGRMIVSAAQCQALIRRKSLRKRQSQTKGAILTMQKMARRVKPRIAYVQTWKKLVKIEAVYRGHLARTLVDDRLHPTKVRRNDEMMREIVSLRPRGTRVTKPLLDQEYRHVRKIQMNLSRTHDELRKVVAEKEEERKRKLEKQAEQARFSEFEASQLASRLKKVQEKLMLEQQRALQLEAEKKDLLEKQSEMEQDLKDLANDAAQHTATMYDAVKKERDSLSIEKKDMQAHLQAELELRLSVEKQLADHARQLDETQQTLQKQKQALEELESKDKQLAANLQEETRSHKIFELKAIDLEERNQKMEFELSELRETAKKLQMSEISLKTGIADAQGSREEMIRTISDLQELQQTLQNDLHREIEERQALELARDNRESMIESLTNKLTLANQSKADAIGMLQPLQQSIDELQDRCQKNGTEKHDLERRLRECCRERELMERKLELELKSKEHIKQEHTELTRRVAELELTLESRNGPRAKYGHLITDEEKQQQERNTQLIVEALEAQVEQLNGNCDLLSRKLDMERDAQQQFEYERMELLSKIATLDAQVSTLSEIQQRSASDVGLLREARDEAAQAWQQLAIERGQRAALESRLKKLEVEEQLNDRSRELDPVITTLRRERDELGARVASLQPLVATVTELREQIGDLEDREFQMRKEVQQANNNLAMIEHKHRLEMESVERDHRRQTNKDLQLTTTQSECQRLREQVALLEAEQMQRMEMDKRKGDVDHTRNRLEEENIRLASRVQILEAEMRSNIEESLLSERARADEVRSALEEENLRLRCELEMASLEKQHRATLDSMSQSLDTSTNAARTDAEVVRLRSQVQLLQAELASSVSNSKSNERSEYDIQRIAGMEAEMIKLRGQVKVLEMDKNHRIELDQKRLHDNESFSSSLEAENIKLRSTISLLEAEHRNRAAAHSSSQDRPCSECAQLRMQLDMLTLQGRNRVELVTTESNHASRVADYAMANTEAECNRLRSVVTRQDMEIRSLREMCDTSKGGADQNTAQLKNRIQTLTQELNTSKAVAEEWEDTCRRLTRSNGGGSSNADFADLEQRLAEAERENQRLSRRLAMTNDTSLSAEPMQQSLVDRVRLEHEVEEWKKECHKLWAILASRGISRAEVGGSSRGMQLVSSDLGYEDQSDLRLVLERETEAKLALEREKNILVVQMEVLKGNLMMQSEMLRLAQDDRAFSSLQVTQELEQAKTSLKQEVADRIMLERRCKELASERQSCEERLINLQQSNTSLQLTCDELQENRLAATMQVVELEAKLQSVVKGGHPVPDRPGLDIENQQLRKRLQDQLKSVTGLQDEKRKLTLEVTRLRRFARDAGALDISNNDGVVLSLSHHDQPDVSLFSSPRNRITSPTRSSPPRGDVVESGVL